MRSPSERRTRAGKPARAGLCGAAVLTIVLSVPVAAAPEVGRPSEAQVTAAVAKLKNDPNLAGARKIRVLRWAGNRTEEKPPSDLPDWLQQIARFFAWIGEAGRYAVWAACAVLVGVLAVYLLRILPRRWQKSAPVSFNPPTHVQDLDIRPESLPDDIGAASRKLWDRGEHRAALALLYRGCLSRLVHAHSVPIRDSTTEGECIELAARSLAAAAAGYVSRLVRVWQRAVYRGEEASPETVFELCNSFRSALDPPPPSAADTAEVPA